MIRRGVAPDAEAGHGDLTPLCLLRTAERCSRAELLASPGVGPKAVDEIEDWLAGYGKRFRLDPLPVDQALAQALDHLEAVLERGHDAEFLAAFVALPQLRRSLHAAKPERRACRCP